MFVGVTGDKPYEVVLEVNEEEMYICILDIDQDKNFVLELKDEMTWSLSKTIKGEYLHILIMILLRDRKKEIVAASRRKLDCKYNQGKYEDKNSNEVLTQHLDVFAMTEIGDH